MRARCDRDLDARAQGSDLTPTIRRWFAERGFEELAFEGEPGSFGVGAHELRAEAEPLDPGIRLFTFL